MKQFTKTKASSILNVLGMTIAFAAFYVIMSQVMYDVTFNHSIKDADKKYMICTLFNEKEWIPQSPIQSCLKTTEAIPGAKIGYCDLQEQGNKVYGGKDGTDLYHFSYHWFTHQAAGLFGLEFTAGKYPEADGDVAISDKVAETMSVAPGDLIYVFDSYEQKKVALTITGVFKSHPANSYLGECDVLINEEKEILSTSDGNFNYQGIVSLETPDDVDKFLELLDKNMYESLKVRIEEYEAKTGIDMSDLLNDNQPQFKLVTLSEIHLSDVQADSDRQTSRSTVLEMIGIALLIVIIAFINFVNFFVALVPEKMRSVNIRKVFGASRASLVWEFVKEALIYVGVAIILACVLILAISKSSVNELTDGGIGFDQNLLTFGVLILVSVIFAVLSALFPALYVTRVDAAMGVKSGFSRSRAGMMLRKVLITLQLAAAVAMMIISAVFFMQYRHMTSQQLGFDKDGLYVADIPYYRSDIKSRVESMSGVKSVTASSSPATGNAGMTHAVAQDGISLTLKVRKVLPNYLDVVGIPFIDGEGFTDTNVWALIVEEAMKDFGDDEKLQKLISTTNNYKLAGFCTNTNSKPATDKTENGIEAYTNVGNDYQYLWYLIVRTEPNVDSKALIAQLKQTIVNVYDLDEEMDAWTVDTEMENRYARFMRQSMIFGLFSLIAIIIALMGVFGIVLFETEHRRHETAVRKVLGAESNDIVGLFCRQYILTVAASCIIATPVAMLVTRRWLQQFTTQVHVSPLIYIASFAIVAVLTLGIIAVRIAIASKENPVNNLKSE